MCIRDRTGLVIKVGNTDSKTGDIFVPQLDGKNLLVGEWQEISIPVSLIAAQITSDFFIETINLVEIFPAWANTQAGVTFQMQNIRFSR